MPADLLAHGRDAGIPGEREEQESRRLEGSVHAAVGVGESDLDGLTEGALADYFISVAPAPWSPAEVRAAYARGLALGAGR